jgi:hypothetical protein
MAAAEHGGPTPLRTIEELARCCGHYCWLERSLFALAGDRASRPDADEGEPVAPEVRVVLSELSARHALWAAQWRDRLPVRAGVDAEALVTPPPGPVGAVVDLLVAEPDPLAVLSGVAGQLLPRLLDLYAAHLDASSAVSEAPVRAVLEWVIGATAGEVRDARHLLDRVVPEGEAAKKLADFTSRLERALEVDQDVFPAARAS